MLQMDGPPLWRVFLEGDFACLYTHTDGCTLPSICDTWQQRKEHPGPTFRT